MKKIKEINIMKKSNSIKALAVTAMFMFSAEAVLAETVLKLGTTGRLEMP